MIVPMKKVWLLCQKERCEQVIDQLGAWGVLHVVPVVAPVAAPGLRTNASLLGSTDQIETISNRAAAPSDASCRPPTLSRDAPGVTRMKRRMPSAAGL